MPPTALAGSDVRSSAPAKEGPRTSLTRRVPCRLFVLFLLLILGLGTVRKKHNTDECFSLGQLFGTAWGKKNS